MNKKKKKGFFIRYFNDFWGGTIGDTLKVLTIVPFAFIPLGFLLFTFYKFHSFPLFWIIFGVLFLILAEIMYLQFAKYYKGNLIGWKIGAVFGALHIISLWLFIPFWIIKWLTKVPYNKIWLPCTIVLAILGLIVLYFWINVMIGKKIRR